MTRKSRSSLAHAALIGCYLHKQTHWEMRRPLTTSLESEGATSLPLDELAFLGMVIILCALWRRKKSSRPTHCRRVKLYNQTSASKNSKPYMARQKVLMFKKISENIISRIQSMSGYIFKAESFNGSRQANISWFHLLLSGDVELNPGPYTGEDADVKETLLTICDKLLIMEDWNAVVSAVEPLTAQWDDLGRKLGMRRDTLDIIARNNKEITGLCLNDTIAQWLKLNYITDKYSPPSWRSLAEAVVDLNKSLFLKIASDHEIKEEESITIEKEQPNFSDQAMTSAKTVKPKPLLHENTDDKSAKFPWEFIPALTYPGLQLKGNFSKEQSEKYEVKLEQHSQEMIKTFNNFMYDFYEYMISKNVPVSRLKIFLGGLGRSGTIFKDEIDQPTISKDLMKAQTIDDMMLIIQSYCSFFNFSLIETMVDKFEQLYGFKPRLEQYKEAFAKYAEYKLVYCCPSGIGFNTEAGLGTEAREIFVKLDDAYKDCRLTHLETLRKDLCQIFRIPLEIFPLDRVQPGSVCVIFQVPEFMKKDIFPLSEKQIIALRELNYDKIQIYSFVCSEYSYDIREKLTYAGSDSGISTSIGTFYSQVYPESDFGSDSGLDASYFVTKTTGLEYIKNLKDKFLQMSDKAIQLSTLSEMHMKAIEGDLKSIVEMIESETTDCNPMNRDHNGNTALHYAAGNGHLHVIKYFVEELGFNCTIEGCDGITPLHYAASMGHQHIVEYLLDFQQVEALCHDEYNCTPLHYACREGHIGVVKQLADNIEQYLGEMQECNSSCLDKENMTPLHLAAVRGHLSVIEYLIKDKACNPMCKNIDGNTPLHLAARYGHMEVLQFLISNMNSTSEILNNNGRNPLHVAAMSGNLNIVQHLVKKEGYSLSFLDADNNTPLHLAADNGHLSVEDYLAKESGDSLELNENERKAIFDEAMQSGHIDVTIIKILIVGAGGVGKSCLLRFLCDIPIPTLDTYNSTNLIRAAQRVKCERVRASKDDSSDEIVWELVGPEKLKSVLAEAIKSRAAKVQTSKDNSSDAIIGELVAPEKADDIKSSATKSSSPQVVVSPSNVVSLQSSEPKSTQTSSEPESTQTISEPESSQTSSEPESTQTTSLESISEVVALIKYKSGKLFSITWIYLVDSGGQPQFHELLTAFVRNATLGIFVFNLSEQLDDKPEIKYYKNGQPCGESYKFPLSHKEIFQHCVQTISSLCPIDCSTTSIAKEEPSTASIKTKEPTVTSSPEILVVGTHREEEDKSEESREDKEKKLREILQPYHAGIIKDDGNYIFPIDSISRSDLDKDMRDEICRRIVKAVKPFCKTALPLQYYALELELELQAEKRRDVISYEHCFKEIGLPLNFSRKTFLAAIQHLDELNLILYFKSQAPDVIFTNPNALLDKVGEIVEKSYIWRGNVPSNEVKSFLNKYVLLVKRGEVTLEMLKSFESSYVEGLFDHVTLTRILTHLFVLLPISKDKYFMPALLDVSEDLTSPTKDCFAVSFRGNAPMGLFSSSVVYLLSKSKWKKRDTPGHLFRNSLTFNVDIAQVTLLDRSTYFEVHIEIKDCFKKDLAKVKAKIRKDVINAVNEVKEARHLYNLEYSSECFCCPCSSSPPHLAEYKFSEHINNFILYCTKDGGSFPVKEWHKEWLGTSSPSMEDVAIAQEVIKDFNPVKVSQWLHAKGLSEEDCEKIKEGNISGRAFLRCSKEDWTKLNISLGGIYTLMDLQEEIKDSRTFSDSSGHSTLTQGPQQSQPSFVAPPQISVHAASQEQPQQTLYPQQGLRDVQTVLEKRIDLQRMRILKWTGVNGQEQIVSIMDDIAHKWKAIGEAIGIRGPKLLGWETAYQKNSDDCLFQVITTWLESGSVGDNYPATWKGLISLLKDLKLNETASQIEAAAGDPDSQLYK